MREKLLSKLMLLLAFVLVGAGNAWADTTKTSTLTFTAKCEGSGTADDGVKWTVESDGTESNFDNDKGIHYGTNKAAVQAIKLSTNGISGTITKIVVNASAASGVSASLYATVNGVAFGTQEQAVSATATEYTFEGSAASGLIEVKLAKPESANKALYIKSVAVTYTTSGNEPPVMQTVATPTFNPAAGEVEAGTEVTIATTTEGAKIYYTTDGSDPDNTSQEYTGAITVDETTTIKAIAYKDNVASAIASATYTIAKVQLMTIAEVRAQATGAVSTKGIVTSCVGKTAYIQDATAAICVYGSSNLKLNAGDEISVTGELTAYNGLLEITSPEVSVLSSGNTVEPTVKTIAEINADKDYALQGLYVKIVEATVTAIDKSNTTLAQGENTIVVRGISSDVNYAVNDVLTLEGNIGCYNGAQIANPQNVTVEQGETPVQTVATPTFSPEAGEVEAGKEIVISCATEGATIYYTLDESDPTAESTKYTAPITVNERTVIKAIAVKEGMTNSAVATAEYTIKEEVGPGDEGDTKTDVLNREFTGITGTTYTAWSGKTSNSDAVYAGQSAGGNESIQLRSNNNNSGVVTTTSGGKVKKIIVTWNSNTADGRTLNVYGSNTAYTAATDLYDEEKQGTLLGTIVNGTSTELVVTGDYEYVGLRSASGAMYLDKVKIVWAIPEGGETSTAVATTVTIDATGITNTNLFAGTAAGKLTAVVKTASGEVVEGAVVAWESDNEDVASVGNDGTVTLESAGTAVITASYAGVKDQYKPSEATYTLTVTNDDPNAAGTADNPYTVAQARVAIDAGAGVTGVYAKGIVSEIVTEFNPQYGNITYNISEDGTTTGDQLQAYRGKGKDGANFTSEDDIKVGDEVVIYGNLKKYVKDEVATYEFDQNNQLVSLVRPETGLQASDFALTGDNTALTFDLYNKKDAQTLAFTTSSTGAITVDENAYVTVRVDESNKTITVTPKATTPGEVTIKVEQAEDNTYEAGKVTFTVLITNSNPDVVGCTKDNPYTVAQAIEAINAGEGVNGIYVKGIVSEIKSLNPSRYQRAQYYISDDGTTENQFYVYNGYYLNGEDFTSVDQLQVGDEVVVFGNLTKYNDIYEFDQNNYLVSLDRTYTMTIGDTEWATFCSPVAVAVPEGVTAYMVTEVSESVTLTKVEGAIMANTGYVLNGPADTYVLKVIEGASAYNTSSNLLKVSDGTVQGDGASIFALGNKGEVGFYLVANGVTVPAGKAYLVVTAAVRDFLAFANGEADGINAVDNGQFAVGNVVYDLSGRRVEKAVKGIYIVNGKKVVK